MNRDRLLQRFLRYVKVDTAANPKTKDYPSSQGQFELGAILLQELLDCGLTDAVQDQHGLVMATIPSNLPATAESTPVISWCSHLDTSPEQPGANVNPQVIEDYQGGDIVLPGDPKQVITVEENPELEEMKGGTLITTDGTTLLGGDDKAGLAIIMETTAWLMEHPEIEHGPIRICFTCDEEIGRGTDKIDLETLGADACYTLDGQGAGEVDVETFSADGALVTIQGRNIHPSIGKGRMINAMRIAGRILDRLPLETDSPESTDERQGFLHPYVLQGGVAKTTIEVLVRGFDDEELERLSTLLRKVVSEAEAEFPGAECSVEIQKQYRNMRDGLLQNPLVVENAEKAVRAIGLDPQRMIIRGGTDGSRLTEMGLPTPNLSSGQHTPHSLKEWASLDQMEQAVQVLVELAQVWVKSDCDQ
jgi:tripeptide aminopeptidase